MSACARTVASTSALNPSAVASLTSAPAPASSRTDARSPARTAKSSAVKPFAPFDPPPMPPPRPPIPPPRPEPAVLTGMVFALTSAPCSISTRATPACFSASCPHQGRLTARRLLRVRIAAVRQQQLHHLDVAAACGREDGTLAPRVRVGAGLQQPLHHRGAGVERRESERSDAALVGGVHLGASSNEQVGDGHIVAVRGPVERGRAVRLGDVDVDLLLDQPPYRVGVNAAHGINQAGVGRGAVEDDACQGTDHASPRSAGPSARSMKPSLRSTPVPSLAATPTEARAAGGRSRRRTSPPASPACSGG